MIPLHRTVQANKLGRDFVVSDVHGMYKWLMTELEAVQFDVYRDRLFSVGDLIDRGKGNLEMLKLTDEPWFHAVQGNHEDLFVGCFMDQDLSIELTYFLNGGKWALRESDESIAWALVQILKLPYGITIDYGDGRRVGIVHADVPGNDWNYMVNLSFPDTRCLWSREKAKAAAAGYETDWVKNVTVVYSGHTSVPYPIKSGNHWFFDTSRSQKKPTLLEIEAIA